MSNDVFRYVPNVIFLDKTEPSVKWQEDPKGDSGAVYDSPYTTISDSQNDAGNV